MKIPLNLPKCTECGRQHTVWLNHDQDSFDLACPCGMELGGTLDLDFTLGFKCLLRSEHELLRAEDYDLSIVLSATAFEWQLAFLHKKWAHITAFEEGRDVSSEELERMWQSQRSVFDKVKATGRLLWPSGFESYVQDTQDFHKAISSGFPSLDLDNLTTSIHKTLFVPRNRIVHYGVSGYTKEQAVSAYNVARLCVSILHSMDMKRREV